MDTNTIKSQIDIVDFIEKFIPLRKAGANYQACCPFHNEKSPSFVVSPSKQIYKCFGCDKSGDIFSFLQAYKKLDFKDALNEICQMYGIDNPQTKAQSNTSYLQEQLKKLSQVYMQNLLSNAEIPTKLREYLHSRGFDSEDIARYGLGYCKGDEWKQFFTLEQAQSVGILSTPKNQTDLSGGEQTLRAYDFIAKNGALQGERRELPKAVVTKLETQQSPFLAQKHNASRCLFSNRLVITLYNHSFKVIGFVGRTHPYANFAKSPKYINSKESFIYNKSQNFYNYARARKHILESKKVLVVEGYLDALSADKMGIKNCVATGGTAFNKAFLSQLAKLECEMVFCFDNDNAGQKNIVNALKVCIENGYTNIYKGTLNASASTPHSADVSTFSRDSASVDLVGFASRIAEDYSSSPLKSAKSYESRGANLRSIGQSHHLTHAVQAGEKGNGGNDFIGNFAESHAEVSFASVDKHSVRMRDFRGCEATSNEIEQNVHRGSEWQVSSKISKETTLEVKDLGEILEKRLTPHITKIEGIGYYLKSLLTQAPSPQEKQKVLESFKAFILAQNNVFLKQELITKAEKALNLRLFDKSTPILKSNNTLRELIFYNILQSQSNAYLSAEYIDDELGELTPSFRAFLSSGDMDKQSFALSQRVDIPKLDVYQFKKALWQLRIEHLDTLIDRAKHKEDYKYALALSHKKQELSRELE